MGSSNTSSTNPAATNTGLANAFLNNAPLPQSYTPMPMPSAPSASFADLSGPGTLPGLTGSLIGNSSMPALPKPTGPMPLPPPPVVAPAAAAPRANPNLYYSGSNVRRDGTTSFGGTPGNVTGGGPLQKGQAFKINPHGR